MNNAHSGTLKMPTSNSPAEVGREYDVLILKKRSGNAQRAIEYSSNELLLRSHTTWQAERDVNKQRALRAASV